MQRDRRPLRTSLKWGAAYDVVLGLVVLVAGMRLMEVLGESPDPFLLRLSALPLLVLPVLYWAAASSAAVDAFKTPVLWARGFGGACILGLVGLFEPPGAAIYIVIGLFDLAWAGVHAALWRKS